MGNRAYEKSNVEISMEFDGDCADMKLVEREEIDCVRAARCRLSTSNKITIQAPHQFAYLFSSTLNIITSRLQHQGADSLRSVVLS